MKDPGLTVDRERLRLLRSVVLVASPTSYVVLEALGQGQTFLRGTYTMASEGLVALLLAAAGLLIIRLPSVGRWLASLGAFLMAGAGAFVLTQSPALALTSILGLLVGVAWLWYDELPAVAPSPEDRTVLGGVGVESLLALLSWLLVGPSQAATSEGARLAAVLAISLCVIFGARRALGTVSPRSVRLVVTVLLSLPPLISLGAMGVGVLEPGHGINLLAIGPALLLLWGWSRGAGSGEVPWWSSILEHPARLLVVTFLALASLGAAVLMLPQSSSGALEVSGLDAVFTAVSAVCVTGLVVLDTPTAWSPLGQAIILGLIQLGGLGIMTFYAAAVPLLGRRLSMRHERAIAGALSIEDRGHLYGSLRRVLGVTFGCELAGTLLLLLAFSSEGQLRGEALWQAVFTSISAFCNAGFALDSQSLSIYGGNPLVLHTVAAVIIAGGLSPLAVISLP
jgi:trk system potassium uptake protein